MTEIQNTQKKKDSKFIIYNTSNSKVGVINEKLKSEEEQKANDLFLKTIKENVGEPHPFDYKEVEGVSIKFGLASAVINKYLDFILGTEIFFDAEDEKIENKLEEIKKEIKLQNHLRNFVQEGLTKGPGFLEVTGLGEKDKESAIKNINSNTMFVVKDKQGNIIRYNQYIGTDINQFKFADVISFKPEEIIQFNINKASCSSYGYGIIYPALITINDFLLAQKSIHKLTKRKANVPIHAKLGNAEKDDYPTQEDIDAFGEKLQFMNETTEWSTGPNVEFKVIDFGNIGEKFTELLDNDYKLLSYSFQVPEVLLGAGNVPEGLAKVQMDAFERRIRALQQELGQVLKDKLFKPLLNKAGYEDEFEIIWGQPSEDDINKKVQLLLQLSNVSPGLKYVSEERIAELLNLDYKKVEQTNKLFDAKQDAIFNAGLTKEPIEKIKDDIEKKIQKDEMEQEESKPVVKLPGQPLSESVHITSKENINAKYLKGIYKKEVHKHNIQEDFKDYSIQEWVNINVNDYVMQIISAIQEDDFTDLKANNNIEKAAGYLGEKDITKLKTALQDGFIKNKSIKEIEQTLKDKRIVRNLYAYNEKGLELDDDGNKKMIMNKDDRTHLISRTETVRMANQGALNEYKDKGVQEVIWISALDDRSCEICDSLNGQILEANSNNLPPINSHPYCRCSIKPYIKGLTTT